ncbi:MAG: hypothetical protein HY730_08755 [Candidatus Tectomicrobia bacterium]|uniref:Uncharacterized protein n=1 Tax=Tectimicrobiota bacterium TaxID=2528274 RepID=A0A933GM53_UNCTE|nr:hypothetical protein [Candidatus Tectomicrobia bacterium]
MMVLEMLRMKFKDEKGQSWIDMLEENAQRGSNLIKQVLTFARGSEGEITS